VGEVVAAAVVAHQPLVMVPSHRRVRLGGTGRDTTLVEPGYRELRAHLAACRADTLVIVDTHWFTTSHHAVAGADHFRGVYTSDEMPDVITDVAYDYPGAPDLARLVTETGRDRGLPMVNATSPALPRHYPTINLVHHLHTGQGVLSLGVLQTASPRHFLDLGAVLADAVARSDRRVAVLGSGGLSHTFWPIDDQAGKIAFDPDLVFSRRAQAYDGVILDRWSDGDHAGVVDLYPEYETVRPEGLFAHYFVLLGAIGGVGCRARGRQVSSYENALGTGQVHVVFDLAAPADRADR
jgi:3,4-dihydroxyphenylacetate 2,3-dioxygenase